jgi:hypothetical protein
MENANETELDLGDDMVIKKLNRRESAGGMWVVGSLHGYKFNALVFPEHAENPEYEIGQSKISKLWLQRMSNTETVYNWDRGADIAAANPQVAQIVGFLCAGLADYAFAE